VYECLVLIDPENDVTAAGLAAELRRFYATDSGAPSDILESGPTVKLRWQDYTMTVYRSSLPHVLEESAEIANEFAAGRPDRARIARCQLRFEISAEDDPNMGHFNDYLFVGEALQRLARVYRFEQASGEFLE